MKSKVPTSALSLKFQLWINGLTDATVYQDPHKFVINIEWKTTTIKNYWKEVPVIPIQTISALTIPIQ